MNEFAGLYLFLIAVYLFDCFLWGGPRSVAFKSPFLRRWKLSRGASLIGSEHPKAFFCNPLPPLGAIFLSQEPPITLSRNGIGIAEGQLGADDYDFLRFSEIRTVSAPGKHIVINDRRFCECISSRHARELASFLERLLPLSSEIREQAIREQLQKITDAAEIEKVLNLFRDDSSGLRWSCNLLFWFVFLIVPAELMLGVSFYMWPALAGILFLIVCMILIQFWNAHTSLFTAAREEKWTALVSIALFPPNAVRAVDALSADLLARFHPLAISQAVGAPDFQNFASETLRRLRFPKKLLLHGESLAHDTEHRAFLSGCIERLITSAALDPAKLVGPPVRDSLAANSYCPRCWAQYVPSLTRCTECDIATVAFASG